ncbi:MAG: 30S ribosomal protein S3 [Candidatus Vogelbacteria bacterium CG10_big_fil_rev_8_21_14_0_10_45_14]|uniref:Small ribosomal subunit protein uS3 n=1 Tax=Candidatus Vogelbacteria bacterium CG10_big_fil_rev_8_21_14_0_10_45_14 TaxID=1975042 RepID=A0A2H0RJH5_9BACT|nr:MAG: 30S ribosomal protein S3 [Candidatus Vogelbacteria bacterium CG10_big_fil_rev_8_21_14_0_10_45_14]
MSHTVHPYAHRIGILRDWKSRWFGSGGQYQEYLKQDVLLREFLVKHLKGHHVASVDIERGQGTMRILVKSARPGLVIGRSGEGTQKLRDLLLKKLQKIGGTIPASLKLDVEDVKVPEASAPVVAEMVAEALEKRMSFRRVLKQTVEKVLAARDVQGVKITVSGRLDGAEMGRTETIKKGRLPLQTFRADVDFARKTAFTTYSAIGVKVWIYRGDIFDKGSNI